MVLYRIIRLFWHIREKYLIYSNRIPLKPKSGTERIIKHVLL